MGEMYFIRSKNNFWSVAGGYLYAWNLRFQMSTCQFKASPTIRVNSMSPLSFKESSPLPIDNFERIKIRASAMNLCPRPPSPLYPNALGPLCIDILT